MLFATVNVPGPDKNRPGLDELIASGIAALDAAQATTVAAGTDLLGSYRIMLSAQAPVELKARAAAVEGSLPGGRVLDLDVLTPDGEPVDRQALGLEPRRCYVCDRPARECMVLRRHALPELLAALDACLAPVRAA